MTMEAGTYQTDSRPRPAVDISFGVIIVKLATRRAERDLATPDLESPSYPKRALISPVCAEYSESVYLFHFVGF
jgi:hypothetical protein